MVDLGREKVKVLTLDKELAEARKSLRVVASEHGMLCAAIKVICDDLRVAQAEGTSSLVAHVDDITTRRAHLRGTISMPASFDHL
jgi:hypothetical protein